VIYVAVVVGVPPNDVENVKGEGAEEKADVSGTDAEKAKGWVDVEEKSWRSRRMETQRVVGRAPHPKRRIKRGC
jgi:hypothetical protein